jgi:hypothetical protein
LGLTTICFYRRPSIACATKIIVNIPACHFVPDILSFEDYVAVDEGVGAPQGASVDEILDSTLALENVEASSENEADEDEG